MSLVFVCKLNGMLTSLDCSKNTMFDNNYGTMLYKNGQIKNKTFFFFYVTLNVSNTV